MPRKAGEWKSIGMGRNGIALECAAMESQGLAVMRCATDLHSIGQMGQAWEWLRMDERSMAKVKLSTAQQRRTSGAMEMLRPHRAAALDCRAWNGNDSDCTEEQGNSIGSRSRGKAGKSGAGHSEGTAKTRFGWQRQRKTRKRKKRRGTASESREKLRHSSAKMGQATQGNGHEVNS